MKKSIKIECYSVDEVLGIICKNINNDNFTEFQKDLNTLKEIDEDEEYFDYIEKLQEISYKYTSGFWYCHECEYFFSSEDFKIEKCPLCWHKNA